MYNFLILNSFFFFFFGCNILFSGKIKLLTSSHSSEIFLLNHSYDMSVFQHDISIEYCPIFSYEG